MTICKAPKDRRSAPICVDGGQPLPIYLQGSCPIQCQSFISCGAELLTARHLICASKIIFGCQNLHCHLVKPHVFAVSRTDFLSYLQPNQCCYPECHLRKGTQKEHFSFNIWLRKERSFKFSTRFSSSSFANADGAVCQKLFHKISHLTVSSTRPRVDGSSQGRGSLRHSCLHEDQCSVLHQIPSYCPGHQGEERMVRSSTHRS